MIIHNILLFILAYAVACVARAIVQKEKKKIPFFEGLKQKETQLTALSIAAVMTVVNYFI